MQKAMVAFGQNGYTATSITDLLEETHLARGSLYGAFGDKRQLFRAALEKYDQENFQAMEQLFAKRGPVKKILSKWLNHPFDTTDVCTRQACLMFRAAMELAPHDPEIDQWLKGAFERYQNLLVKLLQRGKASGELRPGLNCKVAARYLGCSMHGLKSMRTMYPDCAELPAAAQMVLKAL